MADEGFGVIDVGIGAILEDVFEGFAFLDIASGGCGGVGGDDGDIGGLHVGFFEGKAHALGLAFWVGEDGVSGV